MTNLTEIKAELDRLFVLFEENHSAGTKTGAAKARVAAGEIKKLITPYRKASVEANR